MIYWRIAAAYFIGINIFTFAAYGWDKRKARKGAWRTPESSLLLMAVLGGSLGAIAGMRIFRHKTLHKKFTVGIPVILILQVACAAVLYVLLD